MWRFGPMLVLMLVLSCRNGESIAGCDAGSLELAPGHFTEEGQPLTPLSSGDAVSLAQATQGGQVLYVASRVRGLPEEPDAVVVVQIEAFARDPTSGAELAHDLRTIRMLPVPGEPGVMQPELRSRSQVAHLVLCPNYETRDLIGAEWLVELTIEEFDVECPKRGAAELLVVPNCDGRTPENQALCECECEANYTPGKCR
jgi:hypothetical protein